MLGLWFLKIIHVLTEAPAALIRDPVISISYFFPA